MGFSRQDYWSGKPFPSPGDLLVDWRPRGWTRVSCIAGGFFAIWSSREALSWGIRSDQSLSHVRLFATPWLEPRGNFWFTFFPHFSQVTNQYILFILAPELSVKFIHISPSPSPRPFFRHVPSKALLVSRLPVWAVVLNPGHTVK